MTNGNPTAPGNGKKRGKEEIPLFGPIEKFLMKQALSLKMYKYKYMKLRTSQKSTTDTINKIIRVGGREKF